MHLVASLPHPRFSVSAYVKTLDHPKEWGATV